MFLKLVSEEGAETGAEGGVEREVLKGRLKWGAERGG